MTPVEALADHQQRPRHMGKLLDADMVGEVGSIITGDALRLYLKMDTDGRISQATFQVFGAQAMLGTTSVLMEMLPGLDLNQALALGPADLVAHLGGLPIERLPLTLWGLEALREAIGKVMGTVTPADQNIDHLICRCHGVDLERIREAISDDGLEDVEAIAAATGAGSGCGTCRRDIEAVIDRVLGRQREQVKASLASGRVAAMHQMQRVLERMLTAGDPALSLWDWPEDDLVVLRGEIAEDDAASLADRFAAALHAELGRSFRVRIDKT